MAGLMLVLFQSPPPLYIVQENIPGRSEEGAMVQGIMSREERWTSAEITCRGNLASISEQ